jgi:hypothetical protein
VRVKEWLAGASPVSFIGMKVTYAPERDAGSLTAEFFCFAEEFRCFLQRRI